MSTPTFAATHNLVAFLEKPEKSNGFEQIIDFLNANPIKYALTVNPTVYESYIQQLWASTKAKTVNRERQIQALVDKKKVIITEKSVRSDLMLEDAEGIECLPNDVIFEQLTLMGVLGQTSYRNVLKMIGIYVTIHILKEIFANIKREEKGFSRRITLLFQTIMVQAPEEIGEDSAAPTDSYSTPIITQPSSSKPQKKKSKRKQRKDSGPTEPIPDEATNEEPISTPSCDPPQSGEDRLQLTELMNLCTKLQKQVLDLEEAKTAQAKEIASLKKRVNWGAQEDASKQGRKIADLDADAEVTLIDETQERYDEEMLFDVQDDLQGEEVVAEKEVAKKEVSTVDPVTTTGEVVNLDQWLTTSIDELTLAQTLIEIKAAKPKAVTTATTTITTIKKDQIALDEELALKLHVEEQAELEKERVAQEEDSRAANIEELNSIKAMIKADEQLAARLQDEEQE
ncbi:hypothetical protein Tco_0163753 [Tanacetum coccineum]